MTEITFGRLTDLLPRDAWQHEAHSFTPWLAENIDQLSDAIGMPLELTGTEMAVDTFSADILARNPQNDTVVLIENQLEQTDHTHLGQIMTYLAGLNAQAVVWIAPKFREPHLSAIRWLNQHTAEDFGFFAVRLRVVRIGKSPYAPIFEVIEKPNGWEKQVKRQASADGSAYYDIKQAFWQLLLETHPEMADLGIKPWRYSNTYINVSIDPYADISLYLARSESGIYVRAGRGESPDALVEALQPSRRMLEDSLGADLGPNGRGNYFLGQSIPSGHEDADAWPEIVRWMVQTAERYRTTLQGVLNGRA